MKWEKLVVIVAILPALCWGQRQPDENINVADLLRRARVSQDWLAEVDSFHVKFDIQIIDLPRPEGVGPATRPDAQANPPATRPTERNSTLEIAFDRNRLYAASQGRTPGFKNVRFWDGRISGYSAREGFYELTDSSDAARRNFMTNVTWGRYGQRYWWTPDPDRPSDLFGPNENYLYTGRQVFHGVECYVLERNPATMRIYIGVEDRRLYGVFRISTTHWYVDYKEVAPGCWYPMTHGTDSMAPVDGRGGAFDAQAAAARPMYQTGTTTHRVMHVAINQPLPEEMFKPDLKDGMRVHESIGGAVKDYIYRVDRSPEELEEMRAEAERRKLFGPPPMPPGAVPLNPRLDPLPLNPLALNPAVEFPAEAKWVNGGPVKLADHRGKVVLIVFWAHWQNFDSGIWGNTSDVPDLRMLEEVKDNVVVIGVHVPTTNPARVEQAIKQHNFQFPVCIDVPAPNAPAPWGTMAEKYRVDETPVTYVIDQNGRIAALATWSDSVRRAGELLGRTINPKPREGAAP